MALSFSQWKDDAEPLIGALPSNTYEMAVLIARLIQLDLRVPIDGHSGPLHNATLRVALHLGQLAQNPWTLGLR